jgi:endonuclease/exonuclease/phosphatase family metal-dependent hydrolase
MIQFFRSVSTGILLLINLLVALLFLVCSFAHSMHPSNWWFTGFLGLFFPYLFFGLLFFFLFWCTIKWKYALISALVLLGGSEAILSHVPLRFSSSFQQEATAGTIRIMSWNIRHFIPFEETKFRPDRSEHQSAIFAEIRRMNPDIICFQEFVSLPEADLKDPIQFLKEELGYRHVQFSGKDIFDTHEYSGTAIFSKLPIIKGGLLPFPSTTENNSEHTVFADFLLGADTVRFFSVHLQSFGFGSREYRVIDDVKAKRDSSVIASKLLLRKMRNTFYWHGLQSDFIAEQVAVSPYPVLIAGDLNDVPGSYAYATVRGDKKDAFLERGSGLGATFTSSSSLMLQLVPTLRIDYIFPPKGFEVTQFLRAGKKISDHAYLVADLKTP